MNIDVKKVLAESVRMRYAADSILPYDDNKALHEMLSGDDYYPQNVDAMKIMNPNIVEMSRALTGRVDINPEQDTTFLSTMSSVLIEELGLTPTVEDFEKIKSQDLQLCIVGYGGAMINMLYNMHQWSLELSVMRAFKNIIVFEKDTLDFSNIPRISKSIATKYHPAFVQKSTPGAPGIKNLLKILMIDDEHQLTQTKKITLFKTWVDETNIDAIQDKNYIFVGAPTLETRKLLENKRFFFLGHGDYEVELTHQPLITSGLASETYGSIDIPALIINLQVATAAFIKMLASYGDSDYQQNENIFSFDIKKYIEEV